MTRNQLLKTMSQQAGALALESFRHLNSSDIQFKADKSYVTKVDEKISRDLISLISEFFPMDSIHSEEVAVDQDKTSDYKWYLDPLDGTSNYIFGLPLYGVQIALTKNNLPYLASFNFPSLNTEIFASIESGVRINEQVFKPNPVISDHVTVVIDAGKTVQAKLKLQSKLSSILPYVRSIRQFGCVSVHAYLCKANQFHLSLISAAPIHDLLPLATLGFALNYQVLNFNNSNWQIQDTDLIIANPAISIIKER